MTGICFRFLWGMTFLISFFGLVEPYLRTTAIWVGHAQASWWGLCGVLVGQWIKISYASAQKVEIAGEREAKKFNEQLKLSARFLNAFAIGVIAYAVFQRLNSPEGIFNWGTLIAIWIGLYFHYIAIKILDLWRPEK